jgi:pSer/pThr/pTyr-binding forkhead associated (FHA) protein
LFQSLNGTFLQGKDILPKRETALDDGDIIGLGIETSIEDFDPTHPPKAHYVFKITRKILSKVQCT